MVAYSFQPRFVEPIKAGTKRQTIRQHRSKGHVHPGGTMQLYTGMRTKNCIHIADMRCISVQPIYLSFDLQHSEITIAVDDVAVDDLDAFARADGFADMMRFWRSEHGLFMQWKGVIIKWEPLVAVKQRKAA